MGTIDRITADGAILEIKMMPAAQRVGKSMHSFTISTKKLQKASRRYYMAVVRARRIEFFKDVLIEGLHEKNVEIFCNGCELEDTFCEGRRCEWQAETFFDDKDWSNTDWRDMYYKYVGRNDFHKLSLRNKVKLLNP